MDTPLGVLRLEQAGDSLCRVEFCTGADAPARPTPLLWEAQRQLEEYFACRRQVFDLPLAGQGTAFQQQVWAELLQIPYGRTVTYGELARRLAAKQGLVHMSAQAVGGAVGHNPISILIPCHRVVGSGGNLTGYAGGIDKKVRLLELEGTDMAGLFLPKPGTALSYSDTAPPLSGA